MPDVTVKYCRQYFPNGDVEFAELTQVLPKIIAEELDIPDQPDGRLVPRDIEVDIQARSKFNSNCVPVLIRIEATWFSERAANRQERSDRIARRILEWILRDGEGSIRMLHAGQWANGFVWLVLPETAWSPVQ